MEAPKKKHELHTVGLKVTVPRMKILEILQKAERRHMSAEDVYKALLDAGEEVGLATVYRVLTQFQAVGWCSVITLKVITLYLSLIRVNTTITLSV